MARMFAKAGLMVAAALMSSAAIAKPYVDYTPAKGIWEVTTIEVDGNHVDDYLTGLRRSMVPVFEIMKKRGMVDEYKYLVRQGNTKGTAAVIILAHFSSMDVLVPNRARDEALEKEIYASMSEAEGKAVVAGYEKYRTMLDLAYYNEVTFPK
jgi:hypothetical protein